MTRHWLTLALFATLFATLPFSAMADLPDNWRNRWWMGLIQEAALPLNLTFDGDTLAPVLYSPLQTSEPIHPSSWSFQSDTLRLQVKSLGVKMTLCFHASDTTFTGRFKQGLLVADITLRPSQGLFKLNRPQEPHPPFTYTERALILTRKDKTGATINIGATLTIPDSGSESPNGKSPCVLLISGSGMQNRDEEIMGHKPFRVIADYLARHGIASLRYDDRGTGESNGDVASITTDGLADDAEWLFKWLCKQPGVDPKRVGIAGHSEGGVIAPMIASRNRSVAFVILLAAPGMTGAELLLQQNHLLYTASGVNDTLVGIRLRFLEECFNLASSADEASLEEACKALADSHAAGLSKNERKKIGLSRYDAIQMAAQLRIPWMRRFLTLDPTVYLSKIRCPVLALAGSHDLQVPAAQNIEAITRCVNPKLLTTKQFDNLNHLFQHCDRGLPSEYMLIEETFSIEALDTIVRWVQHIL